MIQGIDREIKPYGDLFVLLLVLLFGSVLRFFRLGQQSIWNDEAISTTVASGSIAQILTNQFQSLHPPGYYFLLHFWQNWFGSSEFSLRLPSALIGIMTVVSMYLLGKTCFKKETGFWASIIMAVMPFTLYYSQEARSYSTLLLLSVWMILSQVKIWRRNDPTKWWGLYFLTAVIGLYMHFFFALIVGTMILYFIVRYFIYGDGPSWKGFFLVHVLIAILYIPVIFWGLAQTSVGQDYWIEGISLSGYLSIPLAFTVGHFLEPTLLYVGFGLTLIIVMITSLQIVRAVIQRTDDGPALMLILMSFWVPITTAYIISLLWIPLNLPRLMIVAVPGLYLIIAWGATRTKERIFNIFLLICLLGVGLKADYNWLFVEDYQRSPAREFVSYLQDHALSTEKIIYANDSGFRLFNYYVPEFDHNLYWDRDNEYFNPRVNPDVIQLMGGELITPDDIVSEDSFWLILYLEFDVDLQNDVFRQVEERYERLETHDLVGVKMYRYKGISPP